MCEIAGILNRKECIDERFRAVFIGDVLPVIGTDLGNHVVITVIDDGRFLTVKPGQVQGRNIICQFTYQRNAGCTYDHIDTEDEDHHSICNFQYSVSADDLFLSFFYNIILIRFIPVF